MRTPKRSWTVSTPLRSIAPSSSTATMPTTPPAPSSSSRPVATPHGGDGAPVSSEEVERPDPAQRRRAILDILRKPLPKAEHNRIMLETTEMGLQPVPAPQRAVGNRMIRKTSREDWQRGRERYARAPEQRRSVGSRMTRKPPERIGPETVNGMNYVDDHLIGRNKSHVREADHTTVSQSHQRTVPLRRTTTRPC